MRYLRLTKIFFCVALISGLILSVSFLVMSPAVKISLNEGRNGLLYFSGALFWFGLLMTVISWILSARTRKRYYYFCKKRCPKRRPGLFGFFSNYGAVMADICAAISIIGLIICLIFVNKTEFINYITLSLTVLTIQLHAAFNGNIFHFLTTANSRGNEYHGK